MKKYLSIALCLAIAVLTSCSKNDESVGVDAPTHIRSVVFKTGTYGNGVSTATFQPELIQEMNAYYFVNGVLSKVYPDILPAENGQANLEIIFSPGANIYFVANAQAYLGALEMQQHVTPEDDFLQTVINANSPAANGEHPIMTAQLNLTEGMNMQPEITLKRGIARLDINIKDENVQVKGLNIANARKNMFLFAQDDVRSPEEASEDVVNMTFETPLEQDTHEGVCFLYEQAGRKLPITIPATIDGINTNLITELPATVKRNCIYTVTVTRKGAILEAVISIQDWETGDTVEAYPELQ